MRKAYKSKKNYFSWVALTLVSLLITVIIVITADAINVSALSSIAETNQTIDNKTETSNVAFEVKSYDLNAVVHKDHSIVVAQRISAFLPDDAQKIEFSIPSGHFIVTDIAVENTAYKSQKSDKASTISIVDKDRLTKGAHIYNIKYTIKEFDDRDDTKDLFYFKALLPEWKQPIGKMSINISFPSDFDWGDVYYYAGQLGIQDVGNKLTYHENERAKTVTITGEKIPENFGITVIAKLPNGYWEGALDGRISINAMAGIMAIIAVILFLFWLIGGREPVIEKKPQTKPIENVSPVEIGYIFNSRVRTNDVISLFLYFGINGYLRISEYEPKKYRLYRLEEPSNEARHIRNAYNILFEDIYPGRALEMEDIGIRIKRIKESIREDIAAGYSSKEMVSIKPISKIFRLIGIFLLSLGLGVANAMRYLYEYLPINYIESVSIVVITAALLMYMCHLKDKKYSSSKPSYFPMMILTISLLMLIPIYISVKTLVKTESWLQVVVLLVASILSIFFICIMKARGKENAVLASKFMQLRQFIYHPSPRDLLQNHLADKNYYYKMMPYAIRFGGASSWAISFLSLNVPEPEWYKDDREEGGFSILKDKPTTIDYAQNIVTFCRTIKDAYHNMDRRYWRF